MRSIALETNEVDMAEIAATDVSRFESGDYNITEYMNAMSQYLIYNTSENYPLQDVNVRKAVSYAVDALGVMLGGGSDACVAMQAMLGEVGITLKIDALDRAARMGVQNDPTYWDIAEYSDVVTDFTTHFWSDLFNEDNYPDQGAQGFTQDPERQRLLKAAIAGRSEEDMNAFHDYVVENCYMYGLYTEIRTIVSDKGLTDVCIQKENPVLNAMTFTADYTPAK